MLNFIYLVGRPPSRAAPAAGRPDFGAPGALKILTWGTHPYMVVGTREPVPRKTHQGQREDDMKKLMWLLILLCLCPLPVGTAMAGRTDRLCYDFDARSARVKERIAWNEKMLYDDLAGLQQDRARTSRNPKLALADEKLRLAIRLCNDAITQVQILKDRVPREIDCGERHRAVRRQIDAEVMALTDVEGKISSLNIIVNQYRNLRLEAASIIQNVEGGSRY
jgi:hypothetical protein